MNWLAWAVTFVDWVCSALGPVSYERKAYRRFHNLRRLPRSETGHHREARAQGSVHRRSA